MSFWTIVGIALAGAGVAIVVATLPDIKRYLKIESM